MTVEAFWTGYSGLSQQKKDEALVRFLKNQRLPRKIGLLYNEFVKKYDYALSYKTFQRMIAEYTEREIISVRKIIGGTLGTTTIIEKVNVV